MHQLSESKFRLLLVASFFTCLVVMLSTRLVDIQLFRGAVFLARAEDNRHFTQRVVAERGVILDRYGEPLVSNKRQYLLANTANTLHPTLEAVRVEQALPVMATDPGRVRNSFYRWYRYPEALSQILGYIGPVTADELLADSTLNIQSLVGKIGLERVYDAQLRGRDGSETFEVNALGQQQRKVRITEPVPGQNVKTTLDPYLAQVAFDALGGQKGSVVISDASTGAILAAVNKPTFDPRIFEPALGGPTESKSRSMLIQSVLTDPRQLFFNRAVGGSYPPGSVFKLVTTLAGFEKGAITRDTTVLDEGILKVGEYEYRNWYFTQYGRTEGAISVVRALARSNDIYFYKVAEWVGPTFLADMARQFGFGEVPGSELGGEAKGLVPDPAWKEAATGDRWYLGNTYHFGIGQGDLLVSPLQVNQMVQAIGNQGVLCQPHFTQTALNCREISVTSDFVSMVIEGMISACSPGGTAFPFFPRNAQTTDLAQGAIACKTGTAEFGGQDERGYRKTHGWFVAIVEPRIKEKVNSNTGAEGAEIESDVSLATTSAKVSPIASESARLAREKWGQHVSKFGFPEEITMTVLVESDEAQPFKEGSREAAPVAKSILDWIEAP